MQKENLRSFLYADRVDAEEFGNVLLTYFSNGRYDHDRVLTFFRDETPTKVLSVTETRNRDISRVDASAEFTKDELREIQKVVREKLVDGQVREVGSVVAYAENPVAGYFRASGFQILPAPIDQPDQFLFEEFPLVIEVGYIRSPDESISRTRRDNVARSLIRRLNLLLNCRIQFDMTGSGWAWVHEFDDSGMTSQVRQLGYVPTFPLPNLSAFSEVHQLDPIPLIDAAEYYRGYRTKRGGALVLPSNVSELLSGIRLLDIATSERFERALTWFAISERVWRSSRSASYMALATAIESVMPSKNERCDACGQPVYKLGATFAHFLAEYVPNIRERQPTEETALLNAYYGTRSGLTHGALLLDADINPSTILVPTRMDQDRLHRSLSNIVAIALFNWLIATVKLDVPRRQTPQL